MKSGKRFLTAASTLALVLGGWLGLTAATQAQQVWPNPDNKFTPQLRVLPRAGGTTGKNNGIPLLTQNGLLKPFPVNPGAFTGYLGMNQNTLGLSQWGYGNMNPYYLGMNPYQSMNPFWANPFLAQGQVVGMSPWQLANPFMQLNGFQNPWQFNGLQNPWQFNGFQNPWQFNGLQNPWQFNGFQNPWQGNNWQFPNNMAWAGLGNFGGFNNQFFMPGFGGGPGGINNPFLMSGFGNGLGNQGGFPNPFLQPGFGGGLNNNPLPAGLR